MKRVKKIAGLVGFWAVLLAILIGLSHLAKPVREIYNINGVKDKIKSVQAEKDNSIDVVFLGDSETYSAFNPLQIWKEHGYTSYILGTSAQRLCDSYEILKETCEKQSPSVVVLEANCFYRYAGISPNPEDKEINALGKYLPIFYYHNRWKNIIDENSFDTSSQKMERVRKGFKYRDNVEPYKNGEWMQPSDDTEEFADLVEDYLVKIKELCDEKEMTLVVTSVPAPANWNSARHNSVQNWADKNNIEYYDMNTTVDEIGIDWHTDSRDSGNHMNYKGAVKVTSYFGELLDRKFDFPDRREDSYYDNWNDAVETSGL